MQVGNIQTFHGGTAYNVAQIHDQKLTTLRFSEYDLTDAAAFLHFDPVLGIVDEVDSLKWAAKGTYEITSEHAKYDYAFTPSSADATGQFGLTANTNFNIKSYDYTFDGWFYIDTNTAVYAVYLVQIYNLPASGVNGTWLYATIGPSTRKVTVFLGKSGSWTSDALDPATFDNLFHWALVGGKAGRGFQVYINGKLVLDHPATVSDGSFTANGKTAFMGRLGTSCSYWRYSRLKRWTAEFDPPDFAPVEHINPIAANMALRHNNTVYYAPLVTTPSPPCLAVRRNNQTFYTLGG